MHNNLFPLIIAVGVVTCVPVVTAVGAVIVGIFACVVVAVRAVTVASVVIRSVVVAAVISAVVIGAVIILSAAVFAVVVYASVIVNILTVIDAVLVISAFRRCRGRRLSCRVSRRRYRS